MSRWSDGTATPNRVKPLADPWWDTAPIADICRPPSAATAGQRSTGYADREMMKRVNKRLHRAAGAPTCRVPGCERKLWSGNKNGVCRSHNHMIGYCRCPTCLGRTTDG